MAEFTPITSQEEFDSRISERLQRERAKYSDYEDLKSKVEQYKDYEELKKSVETLTGEKNALQESLNTANSQIEKQKTTIKGYETGSVKTRIAHELGIPYQMIDRLKGETEEDIRKDAESIRKLIGTSTQVLPLRTDNDQDNSDPVKEAWKKTVAKLESEGE
ncbi:MAG: DUF4355 domain-containing protein [Solobacterium sp.]|nr:DUF4355 domain-containing protein [Solobacterium sp.]